MNELIERIFKDFEVDGVKIPVNFLVYHGTKKTYITYQQIDADGSLTGDDDLIGYVDYYDFDIYSQDNYTKVVEAVKERLKANGFVWQPSRTSADMYETDTKYYHKTLNFAFLREELVNYG